MTTIPRIPLRFDPALYLLCDHCNAIVLIALVRAIRQCPCGHRIVLESA